MTTRLRLRLGRGLSILIFASAALGCHVSIRSYGSTSAGQGGKDKPASGDSKSDKPKGEKPKGETKPDKPKEEKPKGETKPDKPKEEKPKGETKPDKPKEDTKPSAPPGSDSKDPSNPPPSVEPPPDGLSRLTVPVRAPFEKLVERVDALLPKTKSQNYKRITKDGSNAVLDAKYRAWRDPIQAKFEGRKLTVTVPIRYAATIRGKVKNPFGNDYFPLVEGQTWGTSSSPQRLRVTVSLELDVNDDWKLASRSKLEGIEHGSPPSGNFCAKVGIDVCTPKKNFAGEVRRQLEAELVPELERELKRADREIEKVINLRSHAASLWAALQRPLQLQKAGDKTCPTAPSSNCKEAAWLLFSPVKLGLSELSLEEGDLGVDVGLEGKLGVVVGKKPKVNVSPLPKPIKPRGATVFQLQATLDVPMKVFGDDVEKALIGFVLGGSKGKVEIRDVKFSIDREKNVSLLLGTTGAYEGKLAARGKLVLDKKQGQLAIEKIVFDDETKKVLERHLSEKEIKALIEKVEKESRISICDESKRLRRAITRALDGALPGQLEVKGSLDDVSFIALDVEGETLRLRVELLGSLGLTFSI